MRLHRTVWASAVISFICTAALAQEPLTGIVKMVDEQKRTITIEQTQSGTVGGGPAKQEYQEYKVKDGLAFNALRPGDKVVFSFFNADGTKTIEKMQKE